MIFITDLDKTFLKSDLSIGKFSKKVWNEIVKKYPLTIATARSYKKSIDFLDGLELIYPMILLDGSLIALPNKKILKMHYLDKNISNEIINIALKFDIEPFIVGFDGENLDEKFLYPKKLNKFQQDLINSYKNDNRLRANDKIKPLNKNLKIVYMGKKDLMDELEKELKKIFKNEIEIKNAKDSYFDCNFLTVLNPYGDKAHAIEFLLEYLDSNCNNLTVFGDSHNDIEMFKKAKISVAVKNAVDELKQIATTILDKTNDEEAVAHYLKSLG